MKIRLEKMNIKGIPLQGVNPLPKFRNPKAKVCDCDDSVTEKMRKDMGTTSKVLPYLMQDRYNNEYVDMEIKTVVLENKYLKATFWPEYGGRLYSLIDKTENRELLFKNPVFKPGNLALRNAWLSGGIEWNVGSVGHTYTTCDNVFAAILKDNDGNDFLRLYEYERCTNVFWQIDFHLPENSKCLISHAKIINPYKEDTTTYWWSNIAVPDVGGTRVLSSCENVLLFYGNKLSYRTLPSIEEMPGSDLSYPSDVTQSFDYFFQPEDDEKTAWEAAAYEDGLTFFEISTSPLIYKKLFCWGNHRGGHHWQEFLSQKGDGFYAEIQAGFARSQMHDKLLKAGKTIEWTQCFGKLRGEKETLHGKSLHDANIHCGKLVDEVISTEQLTDIDELCKNYASMPVMDENIVHSGSGFGALEVLRMEKFGDASLPSSLNFPKSTICEEQSSWVNLLEEGVLPEISPSHIPLSYMTGMKWYNIIKESLSKPNGRHWFSLMQLGVTAYEMTDTTKIAAEAQNWSERENFVSEAITAWEESVSMTPSVWAYRNLAVSSQTNEKYDKTQEFFKKIYELGFLDYSLAVECIQFLNSIKSYEEAWKIYKELPEKIQKIDRLLILAAETAANTQNIDFLKKFFEIEHYDIREGESSLTDIWFTYRALELAKERGINNPDAETMNALIDEVSDTCTPPENIDFRMSLNKKNKYRVEG